MPEIIATQKKDEKDKDPGLSGLVA